MHRPGDGGMMVDYFSTLRWCERSKFSPSFHARLHDGNGRVLIQRHAANGEEKWESLSAPFWRGRSRGIVSCRNDPSRNFAALQRI